jgi:hypothetical protein
VGLPLYRALLADPGEGSFAGTLERKGKCIWVPYWDPEVIKILSLSEASASLRHVYLGSLFLDPEDIRKLSIRAIWKYVKGTGLL